MLKDNSTFSLFEGMLKNNLNYIYKGFFTSAITDNIILFTETNLNKSGENSKVKKRIFTILVEGLQNITRHQDLNADIENEGLFLMQNVKGKYYITTGNTIDNQNILKLKTQINKINSLDEEELKDYYKEVLNDNVISSKGGAGLGLIEMARKSDNQLIFDFVKINESTSYFYLTTEIKQKDKEASIQKSAEFLIKSSSYSSSVHCAYYSNIQLMLHILLNDLKLTETEIETKSKQGSKDEGGFHNWLKTIITRELSTRDFMLVRDFNNFFGQLKSLRIKADYKNMLILEPKAKNGLDLSKSITKLLEEKFTV